MTVMGALMKHRIVERASDVMMDSVVPFATRNFSVTALETIYGSTMIVVKTDWFKAVLTVAQTQSVYLILALEITVAVMAVVKRAPVFVTSVI